jgi:hypothetical protein
VLKRRIPLFVCLLIVLAWTSMASAQGFRPERPYRGLFRGSGSDRPAEKQLLLNVLVGGGYDDNVIADTGGGAGNVTSSEVAGMFGRLSVDLGYTQNTDRINFGASVATDARYFPELEQQYYVSHSGSIGVSMPLGRRTRFIADQSVSYQPFLTLELFPSVSDDLLGVAQPARFEQSAEFEDFMSYRTSLNLEHKVSRRGAFQVNYRHEFSDFTDDASDLRVNGAGARYTHEVARGLGLRVGYGYSAAEYYAAETGTVEGHLIDVGIDYSRALSLSRRTTLSFGTGSTAVRDDATTSYSLVGNVRLNREIARTWGAGLAYSRNVSFVRSFSEPFFSDALTADLRGLVNRRLELSMNGSASLGTVGLPTAADNGFASYSATAVLTYALARNLGATAEYGYYKYNFADGVVMPAGLASDVERQTAQVGLTMWFPLYRSRSSNASR